MHADDWSVLLLGGACADALECPVLEGACADSWSVQLLDDLESGESCADNQSVQLLAPSLCG